MSTAPRFADIVEAADRLSEEQQQALMDILRKRLAERARQRVVQEVAEARAQHQRGESRVVSPDQLLREFDQ